MREGDKYFYGRMDVFSGSKVFVEKSDRWDVEILSKRQAEMLDRIIR